MSIHVETGLMRFQVILNRDGGTLRTLDLDAFIIRVRDTLEAAGHSVTIASVEGQEIDGALDEAVNGAIDVIMVGGGDGTVSAAAAKVANTRKALAILPAGTMNLFARSLGIPLDLDAAVEAFAHGRRKAVDIASANDRFFVHQFSVGLHAKLIRLREKGQYRSRLGKIWASVRAGFAAFFTPPRLRAELSIDGERKAFRTVSVGITNNLFGEGHLPYADNVEDGLLGVYVTRAQTRKDLAKAIANMALGRWKTNAHIDIFTAKEVKLKLASPDRRFGCAIDGELCKIEENMLLRVHPAALNVLVPDEVAKQQ